MRNDRKIFSALFLVALLVLLIYLSISLESDRNYIITEIEINGNHYLDADVYFEFAGLKEASKYKELTLAIIKDRIEKHPYVLYTELNIKKSKKVLIELHEKEFASIVLKNEKRYLVTSDLEIVPIISHTKHLDFPVIVNPGVSKEYKKFSKVRNGENILAALKIQETFKVVNPELHHSLSGIDLRNGRDIIITFSILDFPVVIGKGNEIKKVIYFNEMWNSIKNQDIIRLLDYIDLRFYNHIYLGINEQSFEEVNRS
jgi:cell division protein FtsQ